MDDALEYNECCTLADYLSALERQGRILQFTHIPNETFTKFWNIKMKNKRQGVKPGFPDYVILYPKQMVIIEMKRKTGGRVSDTQAVWIKNLNEVGIPTYVCNGFDEAKVVVDKYL